MLLRLLEQRPERFGDIGQFEFVGLRKTLAIALELVGLQPKVCLERLTAVGRPLNGGDGGSWLTSEEGNLLGQYLGVGQLLSEVDLQLVDDAQVLGTGDRRNVIRVLDDRLVLSPKVLIEKLYEFFHVDIWSLGHITYIPGFQRVTRGTQ
jgi:hypothetical protein